MPVRREEKVANANSVSELYYMLKFCDRQKNVVGEDPRKWTQIAELIEMDLESMIAESYYYRSPESL